MKNSEELLVKKYPQPVSMGNSRTSIYGRVLFTSLPDEFLNLEKVLRPNHGKGLSLEPLNVLHLRILRSYPDCPCEL